MSAPKVLNMLNGAERGVQHPRQKNISHEITKLAEMKWPAEHAERQPVIWRKGKKAFSMFSTLQKGSKNPMKSRKWVLNMGVQHCSALFSIHDRAPP